MEDSCKVEKVGKVEETKEKKTDEELHDSIKEVAAIMGEDVNSEEFGNKIKEALFTRVFPDELQNAISELQALQDQSKDDGFMIRKPDDFTRWQRCFIAKLVKYIDRDVNLMIKGKEKAE